MKPLFEWIVVVVMILGVVALGVFSLFLVGAFYGVIGAGIYNAFRWLT